MSGRRIQFLTVCVCETDHVSCKFHDGKLHTKAETKEWNVVGSGVLDGVDLTVDTAASETTWNQDTADIA